MARFDCGLSDLLLYIQCSDAIMTVVLMTLLQTSEFAIIFISRGSIDEIDNEQADDFEKRMKHELQSDICSYSSRYNKPTKSDLDCACTSYINFCRYLVRFR